MGKKDTISRPITVIAGCVDATRSYISMEMRVKLQCTLQQSVSEELQHANSLDLTKKYKSRISRAILVFIRRRKWPFWSEWVSAQASKLGQQAVTVWVQRTYQLCARGAAQRHHVELQSSGKARELNISHFGGYQRHHNRAGNIIWVISLQRSVRVTQVCLFSDKLLSILEHHAFPNDCHAY